MHIQKAVIPVAGLGTRGLPFTKEVPKELLPIVDTPSIHYIVEEVLKAGIHQIVFVSSKGKSSLEDYFDPSPALVNWLRKRGKVELAQTIERIGSMCEVISVRQKEPLGLGHAVLCARSVVGSEPFAVCLGDEIFPSWAPGGPEPALSQLLSAAQQQSCSVVGVMKVSSAETSSYGIIDIGTRDFQHPLTRIVRTVEKPKPEDAPSSYAIIGRYILQPEVFDCLEKLGPGVGGEIQLTDALDKLSRSNSLYACEVQGPRYDIGSHFSFVQAQVEAALKRPELEDKLRKYLRTLV